jgi:formate dehydrogenase subunit gamma
MLLLFFSGLSFWRPYFTDYFDVDARRWAAVVHAASASILILGIIVHIYAALWVKGTIKGMWTGIVSSAWAKKHHPGWYKEISGGK